MLCRRGPSYFVLILLLGAATAALPQRAFAGRPDVSGIRVTHCLARVLDLLEQEGVPIDPGLLDFLQNGPSSSEWTDHSSLQMLRLEGRLSLLGIRHNRLLGQRFIEILPGNETVYNRHVRDLRDKHGVRRVVYDPLVLRSRNARGMFAPGSGTVYVSGESLIAGKPDLTGLHEATHAVEYSGITQGKTPLHPFIISASVSGELGLPGTRPGTGYQQSLHFEEVVTHTRDASIRIRRLEDSWRRFQRISHESTEAEKSSAEESFNNELDNTVKKLETLRNICEKVGQLHKNVAPQIRLLRSIVSHDPRLKPPLSLEIPRGKYEAFSGKVEMKFVPGEGGKRPTRGTWIFRISEPSFADTRRGSVQSAPPQPPKAPTYRRVYELRFPDLGDPNASLSEKVTQLLDHLAMSARVAANHQERVESAMSVIYNTMFEQRRGNLRGMRQHLEDLFRLRDENGSFSQDRLKKPDWAQKRTR